MDLTVALGVAVVLVGLLGVYRLVRWYWRPRLALPRTAVPQPGAGGAWESLALTVANRGSRTARTCSAAIDRLEVWDGSVWRRIDLAESGTSLAWDGAAGATADISPGSSRTLRVAFAPRLPDGRYRLGVRVLDGEERVGTYVFGLPPAGGGPGGGPGGPT